jgi:hypothetical protein
MNVKNMNKKEFLNLLQNIENEIDEKCGPLDWIDLTPYYSERTVSWTWTNTHLEQDDATFFIQCRKIYDLIINKDSVHHANMTCYEEEEVEHTDGSTSVIEAEVTILVHFK